MAAMERPLMSLVVDSVGVVPANDNESPDCGGALPPVQLPASLHKPELAPAQVSVIAAPNACPANNRQVPVTPANRDRRFPFRDMPSPRSVRTRTDRAGRNFAE